VKEATDYLIDRLRTGDILLVLSAGDGDQISANIVESLRMIGVLSMPDENEITKRKR